jgi:hypothetical protein
LVGGNSRACGPRVDARGSVSAVKIFSGNDGEGVVMAGLPRITVIGGIR